MSSPVLVAVTTGIMSNSMESVCTDATAWAPKLGTGNKILASKTTPEMESLKIMMVSVAHTRVYGALRRLSLETDPGCPPQRG